MSKETNKQAPKSEEPQEVQTVKELASKHGPIVAIGLCVVIGIVAGQQWRKDQAQKALDRASEALLTAQSPGDLEVVINEHPGTPAAALASLRLAKEQYNLGETQAALSLYDEFLAANPTHELVPVAELGKAHALEAMGNTEAARDAFKAFKESHSDSFLAPQAIFGLARCLESLGNPQEAKQLYEEFISSEEYKDSAWIGPAEQYLQTLDHQMNRRIAPGAPEAGAPLMTLPDMGFSTPGPTNPAPPQSEQPQ